MTYHIRVRAGAVIIENNSILLVEFTDENGIHYNLPSGGVEPNETVIEAVQREAKEEAAIDVEVGPLAFVYEYAPHKNSNKYGETHSLSLLFKCRVKGSSTPSFPSNPDPNQTGVKWIQLSKLKDIVLYPDIKEQLVNYVTDKRNVDLIEEHLLIEY